MCLIFFIYGCNSQSEQRELAALDICMPPPHADLLWTQPDLQYLLLGEVHGTSEAPALFAELVCSAAQSGKRVLVGLEFPYEVQSAFRTYIASAGTEEDISVFLAESSWLDMAGSTADGRTSRAIWKMLERLRTLRASGLHIALMTFVPSHRIEVQTTNEIEMAENLINTTASRNLDLTIVLVGNVHARKLVFNQPNVSAFEPMAMHLPNRSTISLLAVSDGGEAWFCNPKCGVNRVAGSPERLSSGVHLNPQLRSGYDGVVVLGSITASAPELNPR